MLRIERAVFLAFESGIKTSGVVPFGNSCIRNQVFINAVFYSYFRKDFKKIHVAYKFIGAGGIAISYAVIGVIQCRLFVVGTNSGRKSKPAQIDGGLVEKCNARVGVVVGFGVVVGRKWKSKLNQAVFAIFHGNGFIEHLFKAECPEQPVVSAAFFRFNVNFLRQHLQLLVLHHKKQRLWRKILIDLLKIVQRLEAADCSYRKFRS